MKSRAATTLSKGTKYSVTILQSNHSPKFLVPVLLLQSVFSDNSSQSSVLTPVKSSKFYSQGVSSLKKAIEEKGREERGTEGRRRKHARGRRSREGKSKEIPIENFSRSRFEEKKGLGRHIREIFFGSVGLGEPQNFLFGLMYDRPCVNVFNSCKTPDFP